MTGEGYVDDYGGCRLLILKRQNIKREGDENFNCRHAIVAPVFLLFFSGPHSLCPRKKNLTLDQR